MYVSMWRVRGEMVCVCVCARWVDAFFCQVFNDVNHLLTFQPFAGQ